MASNTLKINIVGDTSHLRGAIGEADREVDGFAGRLRSKLEAIGQGMRRIGQALTVGVTAPLVALGAKSVMLASDLGEARNVVSVTFGAMAGHVEQFAAGAVGSFGISRLEALRMTGQLGAMLTPMGLSTEQAARMGTSLTGLAGDMASFWNTQPEEAFDALRSAISGEFEPMRRFGVMLSAAEIKQYAYAKGIAATGSELTAAQRAQATYELILERTRNTQGDFARTSDSTANQLRALRGRLTDLGASLGEQLLPIMTSFLSRLEGFATMLSELSPSMRRVVVVVAALAAALGPVLIVLGALVTGLAALLTPVGLVVVAIAALVAGLVIAYTRSETFRNIVNGAFRAVWEFAQRVWPQVRDTVVAAFSAVVGWAQRVWPQVRQVILSVFAWALRFTAEVWPQISGIIQGAWDIIRVVVGAAVRVIGTIIRVAVTAIQAIWQRHGSTITAYIRGLWNAIQRIFGGALMVIRGLLDVFAGLFTGDWRRMWEGVKAIGAGLWRVISGALQAVWHQILAIARTIWATIQDAWNNLWQSVLNAASTHWAAIRASAQHTWDWIRNTLSNALGAIRGMWDGAWSGVANFVANIWGHIRNLVQVGIDNARNVLGGGLNALGGMWSNGWNAVAGFVSGIWGHIGNLISNGIGHAVSIVSGLPHQIIAAINWIGGALGDIGYRAMRALADGIGNALGWVRDAAYRVARAAIDAVMGVLQIRSPSKVFLEAGQNVAEGFALGMEDGAGRVWDAAATMAPRPGRSGAGGPAGGGVINNYNINVAQASADPFETAQVVRLALRVA